MGMALAAEAEDGDLLGAQPAQVGIAIVIDLHGGILLVNSRIILRHGCAGIWR